MLGRRDGLSLLAIEPDEQLLGAVDRLLSGLHALTLPVALPALSTVSARTREMEFANPASMALSDRC